MKKLAAVIAGLCLIGSFQNCGQLPSSDLHASSPLTDSHLKSVIAPSANLPNKRFNIIWLEPNAVNAAVTARNKPAGRNEIMTVFKNYKVMGVDRVVIAYTQASTTYFYKPSQQMIAHFPGSRATLHDGADMLETFFDAAKEADIQLIVGLGYFGDGIISYKLTEDLILAKENSVTDASKIFREGNVERVRDQVNLNKRLSEDIFSKFKGHPSFAGWYITHEPHCLDVAMNLLGPIARNLKTLAPDKLVMISPNADAEACFTTVSSTNKELVANYRNFLKSIKAQGIDIIAYQDSIGAGFQASEAQNISYTGELRKLHSAYLLKGNSKHHYSDLARSVRLNYLRYMVFPYLKQAHDNSGVQFWINTELWRMNGLCLGGTETYGCNYGGRDFKAQLEAWSEITPDLMLNEGFMQFNFKNADMELANKVVQENKPARENAEHFTREYLKYLNVSF